jgi:hypothetical protein
LFAGPNDFSTGAITYAFSRDETVWAGNQYTASVQDAAALAKKQAAEAKKAEK